MKVLHGMSEVAGQGIYSVLALQAQGVDAHMAVWSRNIANYPVDIDIGVDKRKHWMYPVYALKMLWFAIRAQCCFDTYHFHFGYSLIPFGWDLWLDRLLGKRMFAEFHGSDIRGVFQDIPYPYFTVEEIPISAKKRLQRMTRRLIQAVDGIILHDEELLPHLPETDKPVYILPLRLDVSRFEPVYPRTDVKRPVIVHAPSKRATKGTEGILKALEKVQGDYELLLVENKTQQEALELYRRADIVIDQISVGTFGVFALEAMALGKPVITYISDEMRAAFPEQLPIVSADFETLPAVLEGLIADPGQRRGLGQQGRAYVERFHDNKKVAKYLAQIYSGEIRDQNVFHLL